MNELKYYPYSAHKFKTYESCKYKFKLKVVDKIPEKSDTKFFEKGSFIHDALASYPNPSDFEFILSSPKEIKGYEKILAHVLEDQKIHDLITNKTAGRERSFRISFDWKPINQKGRKINYRNKDDTLFWGEIDYIGKDDKGVFIIDWKSGKHYPNQSDDQLKIYVLWLFLITPDSVETIRGSYYYVEHNIQDEYTYHRKDLKILIKYFTDKINKIEQETEFAKSPSKSCDWCGYFEICKPFNIDMEKYTNGKMASKRP